MRRTTIITSVMIFSGLAIGAYFYLSKGDEQSARGEAENFVAAIQFSRPPAENPPDGWRVYENERYGFSLAYPEGMSAREFDEGGGAQTIIFEDIENALGFQIFVVPYSETRVTEERFLKDAPSGVRENPVDFSLDGALATAFYGKHQVLGETAEIWFIREGHLFEITTLKPLQSLLAEIIQTWHFLN